MLADDKGAEKLHSAPQSGSSLTADRDRDATVATRRRTRMVLRGLPLVAAKKAGAPADGGGLRLSSRPGCEDIAPTDPPARFYLLAIASPRGRRAAPCAFAGDGINAWRSR